MNLSIEELKDLNINGIGAMFPNNLQAAAREIEESDEAMAIAMTYMAKIEQPFDIANFIYYLAKMRKVEVGKLEIDQSIDTQNERMQKIYKTFFGIDYESRCDLTYHAVCTHRLRDFVKSTWRNEIESLWDRIVDEYNTTVSNVFYLQDSINKLYLDDLYQYQVLTFAKDFSPTAHVVDGLTVKNDGTVYDEYAVRYLSDREVSEIVDDVVKVMDSRKIFSFASTFEYDPKGKEQFSLLSDTGYCLMFGDKMSAAEIEQGIKDELNKAYNVSGGAIILDWDRTL